jgi:hypothetical protein
MISGGGGLHGPPHQHSLAHGLWEGFLGPAKIKRFSGEGGVYIYISVIVIEQECPLHLSRKIKGGVVLMIKALGVFFEF